MAKRLRISLLLAAGLAGGAHGAAPTGDGADREPNGARAVLPAYFGTGIITLEDRVWAQAQIDRVYHDLRIWPRWNPGPKPGFESTYSPAVIRGKVVRFARIDRLLRESLREPVDEAQVQRELDRMIRDSRAPATLRALFAALHDDPRLIAECLARPLLEERIARLRFTRNHRFAPNHSRGFDEWLDSLSTRDDSEDIPPLASDTRFAIAPDPALTTASGDPCDSWRYSPGLHDSPDARAWYTAVWTGAELIIWGGRLAGGALDTNTGWRFNPALDNWTPTSTGVNVPVPKEVHSAVWTGNEMIIWGGAGQTAPGLQNSGGRYNPATDSWLPTSIAGAVPGPRYLQSAVWTGTEMIIWGGNYGSDLNSGGRYNPSTDSWIATSVGANVPTPREYQSAVWTGNELIVWGGMSGSTAYSSGGRYDPLTDSWLPTSIGASVPEMRWDHSAVWTGSEMIVWGGRNSSHDLNTGGRYVPASDTWLSTSAGPATPVARHWHVGVWTGSEMIVWGGYDGGADLNSGGRYTPGSDSWQPTPISTNTPSARRRSTGLWTGDEMLVWGGVDGSGPLIAGGVYRLMASAPAMSRIFSAKQPSAIYFDWANGAPVDAASYSGYLASGPHPAAWALRSAGAETHWTVGAPEAVDGASYFFTVTASDVCGAESPK